MPEGGRPHERNISVHSLACWAGDLPRPPSMCLCRLVPVADIVRLLRSHTWQLLMRLNSEMRLSPCISTLSTEMLLTVAVTENFLTPKERF